MSNCEEHDHCHKNVTNPSVCQTLDEMDFERGIWFAAQHGDLERLDHLLSHGTSPDQRDAAGYTALHYAARNGHLNVCERLIKAGASINATTKAGHATALHRAVSAGKEDIVNCLLGSGADVSALDADGKTVLHRAAELGNVAIVKILLCRNAQLKYILDCKDKLPYDYIGNSSELCTLLK